MGFVILCGMSIEHIVIGERKDAEKKMESLVKMNRKTMRHQFPTDAGYDAVYKWSVETAPLTIAGNVKKMEG
jgi:uncharacterized YccA/Bax inhibitor family protein